jgi:hypothetical protein
MVDDMLNNDQPVNSRQIKAEGITGGQCIVRSVVKLKINGVKTSVVKDGNDYLHVFNTQKGMRYELNQQD